MHENGTQKMQTIIPSMLGVAYFLVSSIYMSFFVWAGLQVEMIPAVLIVIALLFAGLASAALARNTYGFVAICTISTTGIAACIADTWRLYIDLGHKIDGFFVFLHVIALLLLLAFVFKSFGIFSDGQGVRALERVEVSSDLPP